MLTDAFGYWLSGFVDGEGSFIIAKNNSSQSDYQTYKLWFSVGLRADDLPVLQFCQKTTGLGSAYALQGYSGHLPTCKWSVSAKDQLKELVSIFTKYQLRAKKKHDFAVWKQAVNLYCRIKHLGPQQSAQQRRLWQRIGLLREKLMSVRKFK